MTSAEKLARGRAAELLEDFRRYKDADTSHYHDWLITRHIKLVDYESSIFTFDESRAPDLLKRAESGDDVAHEVIIQFATTAITQGARVPKILANYVVSAMKEKRAKKPGPKPHSHMWRNRIILFAVTEVEKFGFPRTRNNATKKPSACSIVAAEISMHEEAVKDACDASEQFGPQLFSRPR